jgi:hypothetical protein
MVTPVPERRRWRVGAHYTKYFIIGQQNPNKILYQLPAIGLWQSRRRARHSQQSLVMEKLMRWTRSHGVSQVSSGVSRAYRVKAQCKRPAGRKQLPTSRPPPELACDAGICRNRQVWAESGRWGQTDLVYTEINSQSSLS